MTKHALKLQDFPFQTFDKIRYSDTDRQGHVNNAVFATFLETGRVEFLYDPARPLFAKDTSFVIVNLNLKLHSEINWPGKIDIGTGVIKLGSSSIHLLQGLFQAGREVATAQTVIVQIHDEARKSHPLSAQTKAFLEQHLLEFNL